MSELPSLEKHRRLWEDPGTSNDPIPIRKPILLWPGVVAVVVQWVGWFVLPLVVPAAVFIGALTALAGGLVVLVWWIFFSRTRWLERLGALVLIPLAMAGTLRLIHKSVATAMMGMMPFFYAVPLLSLALVAWAVVCGRLPDRPRRALLFASILLACLPLLLVRSNGITGDAIAQFAWRWSETPEQKLLAQRAEKPVPSAPVSPSPSQQPSAPAKHASAAEPDWPGFRGPNRDGVIHGVRIKPDWSTAPPERLWKRAVGPGWSSFAVHGDCFFTQEQRGEQEVVACYRVDSGEPVWEHRDAARFWEANAGAGPRATPTLGQGRVYAFGATGLLNALNEQDGSVLWTRNVASEAHKEIPGWGFAGSPLVIHDLVVVAAAGQLAAFDLTTGKQRWLGPTGGWGYSSPHLARIDGVEQILLLNGAGAISVSPADGKLLWEHVWHGDGIVQPGMTPEGDVLIGTGSGLGSGSKLGLRRIAIKHDAGGWTSSEIWTSLGLKPYYNDFVLHKGFAFGFDGGLLACVDFKDGSRKWKGGRYGHGQVMLLAEQDVLLVLTEKGDLALVAANPDTFTELARSPAITGKTWNHPVLARNILLVRNDQQMAAFRLR